MTKIQQLMRNLISSDRQTANEFSSDDSHSAYKDQVLDRMIASLIALKSSLETSESSDQQTSEIMLNS